MRREEFRPRAYEKNGLARTGMTTRLLETPVCLDDDPIDPEKPGPGQPPPKPQDPPPDDPQPDPKKGQPHVRVPKQPRKR